MAKYISLLAFSAYISIASADIIKANLPGGFSGRNGPGIGSWFRTDNKNDETNGQSWCGYRYNDDMLGFAPDLSVMSPTQATYYSNANQWAIDASKYCGLEAQVTDPVTGNTMIMYIIDAFDPKWVRSPGSIDIVTTAYAQLTGQGIPTDKNNVIKGITWTLTGNRRTDYSFKGQAPEQQGGQSGSPPVTSSQTLPQPQPTQAQDTCDTKTCHFVGHCYGAICESDDGCTDELTCNGGTCGCAPQ